MLVLILIVLLLYMLYGVRKQVRKYRGIAEAKGKLSDYEIAQEIESIEQQIDQKEF